MINKRRCKWVEGQDEIYLNYHDNEWGKAVYDDSILFEMFLLECFQAGLSWITILKKREYFRKAYDNYDIEKIVKYDEKKIDELMDNKNLIRHRKKIEASIKML